MRVVRRTDLALSPRDHDLPGVGGVVTDEALDQRALSRPVLPQERVERAGRHAQGHVVEGDQRAEALGHADDLDVERWRQNGAVLAAVARHACPATASTRAVDRATAPNTPPCIVTILIAARWLP